MPKRLVLVFLGAVLMLLVLFPSQANAADVPFSVQPLESAAQRDQSESFFDVVVAPKQTTALKVRLKNATSHTVKVHATVHEAQTSDNGQVDYDLPQTKDRTLKYSLSQYLKGPSTVTVAAHRSATYRATLTMPSQQTNGLVAGALIFTPVSSTSTTKQNKLVIKNKYNYVIAVIARSQNRTWQPRLTIGQAKVQQAQSQNSLAVPLNNVSATFLNALRVETQAINLSTHKSFQRSTGNMQMAPNSHFFYHVGLPQKVRAGRYHVTTTAYYVRDRQGQFIDKQGHRYQYRQVRTSIVTITAKQANQLRHKLTQTKGGLPWWLYALGIGFVILALISIGLLIILLKRRRQQ